MASMHTKDALEVIKPFFVPNKHYLELISKEASLERRDTFEQSSLIEMQPVNQVFFIV